MKLKDDFFTISGRATFSNTNRTEYLVRLNPAHAIYADHFPDNPVTPGVCLIGIIKELLSEKTGLDVVLREASKIRYLKVINPLENNEIMFRLEITPQANEYAVSATVFLDDDIFAKATLKFENKF